MSGPPASTPIDAPAAGPARIPVWKRLVFAVSLVLFGGAMLGGLVFAWRREGKPLPPLLQDPIRDAEHHRIQNESISAEEQYHIAARLSRADAIFFRRAGQAAQMIGDPRKAKKAYRDALVLNPRDAESYYGLGTLALDEGDFMTALMLNARAFELKSDHAQAACNIGWALLMLERKDEAVNMFGRALALDPEMASAKAGLRQASGEPLP